jgi:hypothetical protein
VLLLSTTRGIIKLLSNASQLLALPAATAFVLLLLLLALAAAALLLLSLLLSSAMLWSPALPVGVA